MLIRWYHGPITRQEAESRLRNEREGSYLIRNSESNRLDYSLSIKSSNGCVHLKIVTNHEGRFILGQCSQPFASVPKMIQYYTLNKLPIKGAEHMSLTFPVGY
ncbi:hypothetical protein HELRODRAFT_89619 [Helobdella robusta]|uniref:SH2 domain-containing protein n=1 Tax=Helobdella robusta TaxID=6412 RepID=T1G7F2_HELRO|nr:hypothetical protein HELRODRAFT_89619 [Helobdella robusta]ESN92347.1 hypothetical protein HELRODRAFT_89619 [Helobdella robusta]